MTRLLWSGALIWMLATIKWSVRIPIPLAILAALLLLAIGVIEMVRRVQRREDLGVLLALAAFVFVYPLSGVFQFMGGALDHRGFYDYRYLDPSIQSQYCYGSLFVVFVAYVALVAGIGRRSSGSSSRASNAPLRLNRKRLFKFGALVLALGLYGTVRLYQVSGFPDMLSFLITMDRGRYIGDGIARYVFLSQWVPWGISFLAVAILCGRWGDSRLKTVAVLCGALTVIVVNSYWTGGRATILFGIVPLLMSITRLKKERTAAVLPLMIAVLVAIVVAMTSARSEWRPQISEDIVNIVDWHAGRFSMVGLGFTLAANSGYGLGSTLLEGIGRVINDTMNFAHVPLKVPHVQGIASIIGVYLLNDPDNNSIPPGSICELYYNFGVLGVLVGHYLIGRLVRICSDAVHRGATVGPVLLGACCLLNIGISTFSGTLSIAFYYLAFNGLPLLALCWLESVDLRSRLSVSPPRLLELSRSLSSAN